MKHQREGKHKHAEAFMLMTYASDDGRIREVLWNSRDGVTPFIIGSKDQKTDLVHKDWHNDVYAPDHKLEPGQRYFVDATENLVKKELLAYIDKWWSDWTFPMHKMFASKEEAYTKLLEGWLPPGAPWILTHEPKA